MTTTLTAVSYLVKKVPASAVTSRQESAYWKGWIRVEDNIRIAAYMRLSKASGTDADGGRQIQEESSSISMQRILIRTYIASHFAVYQMTEYQDDGFSGTDFNRPGVKRLLDDAKNGKFDCVIVKDFSRFGRDYMEVGAYLEQIFPFLGIRFISINDHYDSAACRGSVVNLDVNFRNLLYDLYSKDLSQKVKTSLQAKKECGQYVSANAPFGYEKSPDDRHMLIICEEEAEIVRKIFSLALQGMTSSQTAKKLNLENIPAPMEFKRKKGGTSRKPKGDKFYWSGGVICSILRNPVYAGDMQYGKTEKEQVGGGSVLKPRADWKIIKNHHAPIIAREDFEKVQKSRGRSGIKRNKNRHPLAGRVLCGCCKHSLRIKDGKNPYFTCYNRYVTGLGGCIRKINAMFLEKEALLRLEKYLKEQNLADDAVGRHKEALEEKRASLLQDIRHARQEYGRLKQKHYESYQVYSLGQQAEFHSFRAQMQEKQAAIQELQEQLTLLGERISGLKPEGFFVEGDAGFTAEILEQYIEKIIVYSEKELEIDFRDFITNRS